MVHERFLCVNPPPHVREQRGQSDHAVQPPSPENITNMSSTVPILELTIISIFKLDTSKIGLHNRHMHTRMHARTQISLVLGSVMVSDCKWELNVDTIVRKVKQCGYFPER